MEKLQQDIKSLFNEGKRDLTLTSNKVKALLSSCGFNTTGISVSVRHAIDTDITVRVTDPTVNKQNLEMLLMYHYGVQRLDALGLELAGCNQYVTVY